MKMVVQTNDKKDRINKIIFDFVLYTFILFIIMFVIQMRLISNQMPEKRQARSMMGRKLKRSLDFKF